MVIMLQQQTCVVISVVVRVAFKGQRRRVVAQSHEEDYDCAQDHHRSHQEEAEAVHGARDATPVILLLEKQTNNEQKHYSPLRMSQQNLLHFCMFEMK